jgi:hypothetical protein
LTSCKVSFGLRIAAAASVLRLLSGMAAARSAAIQVRATFDR